MSDDDQKAHLEPWAVLALSVKDYPRLDAKRYGRCDRCRQPATWVEKFGSLLWAVCDVCGRRWWTGVVVDAALDELLDEETVQYLAQFTSPSTEYDPFGWPNDLTVVDSPSSPAIESVPQGVSMFKRKNNSGDDPNADLAARLGDVFVGLPRSRTGDPDNPTEQPSNWHKLSQDSRERWSLVLLEGEPADLPAGVAPPGPWRRGRARHLRPEDFGESGVLAAALRPYYIDDPLERARWKRAEAELIAAGGPLILLEAARRLTKGADILTGLRARHAELARQIEILERRLGLASNVENA